MAITITQNLIENELAAVNDLIRRRLYSKVELVNAIADHIINSGGKRTRPMLVILVAKALAAEGDHFLELAAIVEFIHTATLLHDDVVDGSLLRRGLDTAHAVWGSAPSVLVGDFLYSRAFQMMVHIKSMRVMSILANTTNIISEGEVMQLMYAGDPATSEARYLDVIRCKTAELFKAATELGAVTSQASDDVCHKMASFGLHLGMAYQITDDILDFTADSDTMGKNVGDDLAEGKPTLPLIYAMQHGSTEQTNIIRDAITNKSAEQLTIIQNIIQDTNALDYCRQLAEREAKAAIQCLSVLPASDYRDALQNLAEFAYQRDY